MVTTLLFLHLASTWWMVGLVWFVQIVYYPSLADFDSARFVEVERRNTRLTGFVVGPAMLVELGTYMALWICTPGAGSSLAFVISGGLLAVIWVSTALVQAPCHARLERGFDEGVWRRLVRSNWLRAGAWLARACAVTFSFVEMLK
jgi:uncharacterized membrane protein